MFFRNRSRGISGETKGNPGAAQRTGGLTMKGEPVPRLKRVLEHAVTGSRKARWTAVGLSSMVLELVLKSPGMREYRGLWEDNGRGCTDQSSSRVERSNEASGQCSQKECRLLFIT